MTWRLHDKSERIKTLLMVSQLGHCLNDLLFRWSAGSLPIEIVGVVSNHKVFRELTETYKVPFHYIPVTADTKPAAEAKLLSLIDETKTELVVLARYMQILSPEVCKRVEGRMINIHHSFLPSFKGAKPYHQAHAKGVKLVGATAHYVTPDLDEGPIIEQGLVRVDHTYWPGPAGRGRPGRRDPGAGPRGHLARRAPGAAERQPHGGPALGVPVGSVTGAPARRGRRRDGGCGRGPRRRAVPPGRRARRG